MSVDPATAGVVAITVVAAAIRFATLGTQSYWYDEALTVEGVRAAFGATALALHGQAEPPLYFALAWVWSRIFGYGEAGLRSLSAVFGVLTVPVVYATAIAVFHRRAALAAAVIAALSPALVTYSQEARAYSLWAFLCALSLLFLVRSLDAPVARNLTGWVISSILALLAHYFALFFILPEAIWLLAGSTDRRRARLAVAGLAAGILAIAPLALYQRANGGVDWIGNSPLYHRIAGAGHFVIGAREIAIGLAVLLAVAILVAFWAFWRREGSTGRRAALLPVWVGGAFVVTPVVAAFVGNDYVLDRNLLAACVPFAIVLGACVWPRGRPGVGVAVGLLILGIYAWGDVKLATSESAQRDDWRAVARALGPPTANRVIQILPAWQAKPLTFYDPALRVMGRPQRANEVITITYNGPSPRPRPATQSPAPFPFQRTKSITLQRMAITWYRSPSVTRVNPPPFPQVVGSDDPVAYVDRPLSSR